MAMLNNQRVGVSKCDTSQQPNPAPGPPDFSLSERRLDKGKRRETIRVTAIAALQQICRLWQPPLSHLVGEEHNEHITSITRLDTIIPNVGMGMEHPHLEKKHDSCSYMFLKHPITI